MQTLDQRRSVRLTPIALLAAVMTAFFTATAFADANGFFAVLDTNGDGWLSLDELRGEDRLRQYFPSADLDGNGLLSPLEFAQLLAIPGATPDPM